MLKPIDVSQAAPCVVFLAFNNRTELCSLVSIYPCVRTCVNELYYIPQHMQSMTFTLFCLYLGVHDQKLYTTHLPSITQLSPSFNVEASSSIFSRKSSFTAPAISSTRLVHFKLACSKPRTVRYFLNLINEDK